MTSSLSAFGRLAVLAAAVAVGALSSRSTQFTAIAATGAVPAADDSAQVLSIDHYVRVSSNVPSIAGQPAQIYVRERVSAATALRTPTLADRVVLFVHGAGTPAEVAFDVPFQDYSWMAYLARAGFDTFSMDMTGYGRSTRPAPMNDPCNLAAAQQAAFVPSLLTAPCAATHQGNLTSMASDWNDIGAVVDYIRALRRVDRVHLIGWSQGGPRAGGYTLQHPDKVHKLVLLAPGYGRTGPTNAPALPAPGTVMNTQSRDEFVANWDRQVGCTDQYAPAVRDTVWAEMLASDPVGATWGPGVRRAPVATTWGWNQETVRTLQAPLLVALGAHDAQVSADRVRELYTDAGSPKKVFLDIACTSHNVMWETRKDLLFRASLDWLARGVVNGTETGEVRLGY